ncbi:MAG: glycosyltransferase [Clostridia bacterium]|nr:glycosyltransferase [Clostridia bacterium]
MKTVGIDLTYITNIEGVSGEEVFSLGILKGLYDSGRKQQIIAFAHESIKKQLQAIYPGLHVVSVKKCGSKFYGRRLKILLKRNTVDVFYYPHTHSRINVSLKCETAVTVHGMKSKKISHSEYMKINRRLRKVNYIAAASDFVKNEVLIKNKNIPSDKVVVIYNPVTDLRQGVEIVLKKKFILAVSSDTTQENLIAVLKAFNMVKDEIPHDLVIIGTVSEKSRAYRYIKRYDMKSRIIITGTINRDILFGYYRNADLFVNASTYMGFGYTPVEALACGTKVLTTRIPSVSAIPDVECDGYINNPHRYPEIANKMLITIFKGAEKGMLEERAAKVRAFYSLSGAAEKYAAMMGL